jgi:hypothetical protein
MIDFRSCFSQCFRIKKNNWLKLSNGHTVSTVIVFSTMPCLCIITVTGTTSNSYAKHPGNYCCMNGKRNRKLRFAEIQRNMHQVWNQHNSLQCVTKTDEALLLYKPQTTFQFQQCRKKSWHTYTEEMKFRMILQGCDLLL